MDDTATSERTGKKDELATLRTAAQVT